MSYTPLSFNNPPELSDQSASELLDMLYGLVAAVEYQYAARNHRHHDAILEDFDDDLPEF